MDNYSNSALKNISPTVSHTKSQIMSNQLFDKWRRLIYDNCGIYFQDNKKYLLESRLLKRINYLGLDSYDDYLNYIISSISGNSEKKYLYEAITINETYFFRNQPQLDALIKTIIPEIVEKQGKDSGYAYSSIKNLHCHVEQHEESPRPKR